MRVTLGPWILDIPKSTFYVDEPCKPLAGGFDAPVEATLLSSYFLVITL